MTFKLLYEYVARQTETILVKDIDAEILRLTPQDEIYYTPVDFDPEILLGQLKQYRKSNGVYNADPTWVSEVRYAQSLNKCWQRFVCCKELMHIFDKDDERTDSKEKLIQLLKELTSPIPVHHKISPMHAAEHTAVWMAMAVLCPIPFRDHFYTDWKNGRLSDYDIALALRLPELYVKNIMSDDFLKAVEFLTK